MMRQGAVTLALLLWSVPGSSAPAKNHYRFHLPRLDHAPPPQPSPRQTAPTQGALRHPTLGAPALVVAGGPLVLHVAKAIAPAPRGLNATLVARHHGHEVSFPLRLRTVEPAAGPRHTRLAFTVPASAPRDSFDLVLRLPGGSVETQPRAVRVVHRRGGAIRVAVVADHQLWDPSTRVMPGGLNAGAFPNRGATTGHRAMARQGLHELQLLDPDLVLHLGDLVFGLDYAKEYAEAEALWRRLGPATFFVPGNHDAYARYGVNLKASLPKLAVGMVQCRKYLPARPSLDWPKLWGFLKCVYGDLRPVLFSRLLSDGLSTWRRRLGPDYYAFDLGPYRFVALNTYDGTPQRRHAFSLWVDIRGLHLGAPMVDNYGGYLSVAQLRWLEGQAREATRRGLALVVFGHHDPRGNPTGAAYHPNHAFPTDPVGPDHFEAWNYDGAWDSDPTDTRSRESATDHSGHALLRILAQHGAVYLSGHVHRDAQRRYAAGAVIRDGIVARKPVTFIQVTTASSSPKKGGFWGVRRLTLHPDGRVDAAPFQTAPRRLSMPSGNLWAVRRTGGPVVASLHTGLPRPVEVRVRAVLTHRDAGYDFSAPAATVRLADVTPLTGPSQGKAIYDLRVHLPAAGQTLARQAAAIRRVDLQARPRSENRPPRLALRVNGRVVGPTGSVVVRRGAPVTIDARATDPEGHQLLPPTIADEMGRGARGPRATLRFGSAGRHRVRVSVRDAHGAQGVRTITLTVSGSGGDRPQDPASRSAGCGSRARVVLWIAVALVLLGGLLIFGGRRKRS